MKIEKNKHYMAGPYHAWKCKVTSRVSSKSKIRTVLVIWETGGLKGKEARICVEDMKECGPND